MDARAEGSHAAEQPHETERRCLAFAGQRCVASGDLRDVALAAKRACDDDRNVCILVLDATTSMPVELDLRGTPDDVIARLSAIPGEKGPARPASPGRPKLGVVAREVTLLPRHWEWLSEQPGGASATLRKLVEEARRSNTHETRRRRAQESCYRFMSIMAGDEPGYEEALRALYGGDAQRFDTQIEAWPRDVRDHARRLAQESFAGGASDAPESA